MSAAQKVTSLGRLLSWVWLGLLFLVVLAASTSPLAAQPDGPEPPPQRDTVSATGVSLVSGAYSHDAVDVRIGEGEFPQALVYQREYTSSQDIALGRYDGLPGWGWATNLVAYLSARPHPLEGVPYPPGEEPWQYSVIQGNQTLGSFMQFETNQSNAGDFKGPWVRYDARQASTLVRKDQGTSTPNDDEIVFTEANGTRHVFGNGGFNIFRKRLEAKDGTVLTFGDGGGYVTSVFSNRGFAILFEGGTAGWTKVCAVNLAVHYVTTTSNCPTGVPFVTYTHENVSTMPNLLGATDVLGNTTTYQYTAEDQINCVKLPGQSSCRITNSYNNCVRHPSETSDPPGMNAGQQVLSQTLITGETITYNWPATITCPATSTGSAVTMTFADGSTQYVQTGGLSGGLPTQITDGLSRTTTFVNDYFNFADGHTKMISATMPEGNSSHYEYDNFGNITKTTNKPKSGSGLADIIWQASYGPCNQAVTQIDPKLNQTDISYSSTHCGILKSTLPADTSGVRPETRYAYAQKYAWIKSSGGGFVQAASPVWVLVSEEFCRTSAADSNGNCAAGASDEVITSYEYQAGDASTGSNLFLIGLAVTADGQTLRTCYTHDEYGRRISETQPLGTSGACS